jgi:hypothetical protein
MEFFQTVARELGRYKEEKRRYQGKISGYLMNKLSREQPFELVTNNMKEWTGDGPKR